MLGKSKVGGQMEGSSSSKYAACRLREDWISVVKKAKVLRGPQSEEINNKA